MTHQSYLYIKILVSIENAWQQLSNFVLHTLEMVKIKWTTKVVKNLQHRYVILELIDIE